MSRAVCMLAHPRNVEGRDEGPVDFLIGEEREPALGVALDRRAQDGAVLRGVGGAAQDIIA